MTGLSIFLVWPLGWNLWSSCERRRASIAYNMSPIKSQPKIPKNKKWNDAGSGAGERCGEKRPFTCLRTTLVIRTYITMAGKLFITRETPFLAGLSLFKRTPSSYLLLKPGICKYSHHRRPLSQLLRMAPQDVQNGNHEVKEPTPKIAKLHENSDVSGNPTFFFRVKKLSEKAVLPSRGSPLSAGYDLSR